MPRWLAALLVLLGIAALATPFATAPSHTVLAGHQDRLGVTFPHERHEQVPCVTCHHKVEGMKQTIPCIACHRMRDPAIKLSVEPRFHSFCRTCHEEKSRAGLPHGPVRDCAGCH